MRSAHQKSLVDQEATRGPVQTASGVRADVEEGFDPIALTQQDQRFRDVVEACQNFACARVRDIGEHAQAFGFR